LNGLQGFLNLKLINSIAPFREDKTGVATISISQRLEKANNMIAFSLPERELLKGQSKIIN